MAAPVLAGWFTAFKPNKYQGLGVQRFEGVVFRGVAQNGSLQEAVSGCPLTLRTPLNPKCERFWIGVRCSTFATVQLNVNTTIGPKPPRGAFRTEGLISGAGDFNCKGVDLRT